MTGKGLRNFATGSRSIYIKLSAFTMLPTAMLSSTVAAKDLPPGKDFFARLEEDYEGTYLDAGEIVDA